uniref:Isxac3 transposase n=1 Tax=Babesia bovis TaxID=5865 RepID=S6BKX2_BABBO|nr:isxac3 transposase [Babesia bovis]
MLAPTFLRSQHVQVSIKFTVTFVTSGLNQYKPALYLVALHTLEQNTNLVTSNTLTETLAEHLKTNTHSLLAGLRTAANLNRVTTTNLALLYPTGYNSTLARNGKNIVNSNQERHVILTFWSQ